MPGQTELSPAQGPFFRVSPEMTPPSPVESAHMAVLDDLGRQAQAITDGNEFGQLAAVRSLRIDLPVLRSLVLAENPSAKRDRTLTELRDTGVRTTLHMGDSIEKDTVEVDGVIHPFEEWIGHHGRAVRVAEAYFGIARGKRRFIMRPHNPFLQR